MSLCGLVTFLGRGGIERAIITTHTWKKTALSKNLLLHGLKCKEIDSWDREADNRARIFNGSSLSTRDTAIWIDLADKEANQIRECSLENAGWV